MLKPIKFSIIVPIYNMEPYLARCLDSILQQKNAIFEVICVNDGSTDHSLQLLEDYSKRDDRIIIINKQNAGLGMARNSGLEYATGDYVWFIDSDDWIEKGALVSLANTIEQTNRLNTYVIDMVQTDDKTYQRVIQGCSREQGKLLSTRYAKDLLLYNALFFAQNKIYKYEFIKDYRFNTGFYEDVPQIILFGEKEFLLYVVHEPLYYYYSRPGSIMKTVDDRVLDLFKQIDVIYDRIYKNKELQIYCTHLFYYGMIRTYQTLNNASKKDLLNVFSGKFKERVNNYKQPLCLLFFKEITLRRKMKFIIYIIKLHLFFEFLSSLCIFY